MKPDGALSHLEIAEINELCNTRREIVSLYGGGEHTVEEKETKDTTVTHAHEKKKDDPDDDDDDDLMPFPKKRRTQKAIATRVPESEKPSMFPNEIPMFPNRMGKRNNLF